MIVFEFNLSDNQPKKANLSFLIIIIAEQKLEIMDPQFFTGIYL